MAWDVFSQTTNTVVVATNLNKLQDNFAALAAADSGSPDFTNVQSFQSIHCESGIVADVASFAALNAPLSFTDVTSFQSIKVASETQTQVVALPETVTPSVNSGSGIGSIYTKTDNVLYFQDGAGVERLLMPRSTTSAFHTENNYGTTDLGIRRFTTEIISSDDVVVTVTNTAANGLKIVANMACYLWVSFHDQTNANNENIGLTLNDDALTGLLSDVTDSLILAIHEATANSVTVHVSTALKLVATDIVRPHCDKTDGGNPERTAIWILAIEII